MRFCFTKYGITTIAIVATILSGCSAGYNGSAECYSISQFQKYSAPSFTTFAMNVKGAEGSRIDLYFQIPYRNLRFEKNIDGYKASFSVTFIIRNKNNEIIQTKELERSVRVKTYEESVSYRFEGIVQSFVLNPSEYIMEVVTNDYLSQLRYKQSARIEAKRFTDSTVTASTILLLDTVIYDKKGVSLRPIFASSLSLLKDSFGTFQELYNVLENDTVTITESFIRTKRNESEGSPFRYLSPPYRVRMDECVELWDSIYYKIDSTFVVPKNGTQQIIQYYPLPSEGYNKIDKQIVTSGKSKNDTLRFSNNYFIRNRKLVNSVSIDEVTAAMRYILREEEYDSLVSVFGQERNKRIEQFWESRGGLDRRKEYEFRILEANMLFTACANGSETPMGVVFIICGIPDFIECQGGITETWFYSWGERTFSVPFRREKEHITYYVLPPFSVNESLWQYYIDRWRRKN
jgi:GWxTD domain-containing protein